jgi:hypothetical protein
LNHRNPSILDLKYFYKYVGTEDVKIKEGENYLEINVDNMWLNLWK